MSDMSWGYWARGIAENDFRKTCFLYCPKVYSFGRCICYMYLLWQEAPPDTDVVVEWRRQLCSRVECRVGASSLILILIASNILS